MKRKQGTLLEAAAFYFSVVFGIGFFFGILRTLWVVPLIGVRTAELAELPLMVLAALFTARWTILRYGVSSDIRSRLAVGILALIQLLAVELLPLLTKGMTLAEYAERRDPVSFGAFLFTLALFGVMPLIAVHRDEGCLASESFINTFIPRPDVAETHEIVVRAPADLVFEVAERFDLLSIPLVLAIFRLREIVFRVPSQRRRQPMSLVAETTQLGWRRLALLPDRQLVMGAVTQPWVGDVKFRGLSPEAFANFNEPAFVKIAWTFEAEPIDARTTRFRTRTHVLATDREALRKFARYWVFAGPLTGLIRRAALRAIRREAESIGLGPAAELHRAGPRRSLL
jgi:hypothetical protein